MKSNIVSCSEKHCNNTPNFAKMLGITKNAMKVRTLVGQEKISDFFYWLEISIQWH